MKKNMLFVACLTILQGLFPGCKKDDSIKAFAAKPEKELTDQSRSQLGDITRFRVVHLYKDTVYTLQGSFARRAGEQLIIDAGTLIKVTPGVNGGQITINQGGLILANGSASAPIVFTSLDQDATQNANWNGIVVQGKAPNNSTNPHGDPGDVSGSLNYVRIEFAGLVLNGVGNGTTVENVQVSYSSQSSFEIDGGSFNARNLVSYACGGAADYYITSGYSGKMQQLLAYRHPYFGTAGSNPSRALTGLFIENGPGDTSLRPYTYPVISNMTVIGPDGRPGSAAAYASGGPSPRTGAMITTRNAHFHIANSMFLGFPADVWYVDDSVMAKNYTSRTTDASYSVFLCRDSIRPFFLEPGSYPPYGNKDFIDYILLPEYHNQFVVGGADLLFRDPYNYEAPDVLPKDTSSPLIKGANFNGAIFGDPFFNRVINRGAFGALNWMQGWVNFTPLHTNYNFPR